MSEHSTHSTLPPNTASLLYGTGPDVTWHPKGVDGIECKCEGAAFHSPRPLFTSVTRLVLKEWWPEGWFLGGAPDAYLCGTCRDNLDILLQMLHHTDGDLSWEIRREFGNDIRALALKGWAWYDEQREETS